MVDSEKINSYKKMLLEAKSEAVYEKVSNLYSDDILEYKNFPDEYLKFLIEILSDSRYYAKEGGYHFLAILGVDTDIMNLTLLKDISDAIVCNFINYEDEMLCLTTCDFIARYYPYIEAEKGFADDGLRILRNDYNRDQND